MKLGQLAALAVLGASSADTTPTADAPRENLAMRGEGMSPTIFLEDHKADLLPGSWRVTKIEVESDKADLSDDARRRLEETRRKVEKTLKRINSGELTISTTYRIDGRYKHELRSKGRTEPTYAEDGTWTLDSSNGEIAGKATRESSSTIDGFRIRRLTEGEMVLRNDFRGEREGTYEMLHLERIR